MPYHTIREWSRSWKRDEYSAAQHLSQVRQLRLVPLVSPACQLLLLLTLPTVTVASCIEDEWSGEPLCSAAGTCTNITITTTGGVQHLTSVCTCQPRRYELDGSASDIATEPLCSQSLENASPALFISVNYFLAVLLVTVLAVGMVSCVRVWCRRISVTDTRFERIKAARSDLLRPTRGMRRHARITLTATLIAAVIWTALHLADPFNATGKVDEAGGLERSRADDGRLQRSGLRLTWFLDDVTELILFFLYAYFFLLWRKVCVPAPTLLSGSRFAMSVSNLWSCLCRKDSDAESDDSYSSMLDEEVGWMRLGDNSSTGATTDASIKQQVDAASHSLDVRRTELERARLHARGHGHQTDSQDTSLAILSTQQWATEYAKARFNIHQALGEARREEMRARIEKQKKRRVVQMLWGWAKRGGNKVAPAQPSAPQAPASASVSASVATSSSAPVDPPPAPAEPPSQPAPPSAPAASAASRWSAAKYAVMNHNRTASTSSIASAGFPHVVNNPTSILVQPDAAAPSSSIFPLQRQSSMTDADILMMAASDSTVTISESDLRSFPVPSYLKVFLSFQVGAFGLLVALLVLGHLVGHDRSIFSVPLLLAYMTHHTIFILFLISFWTPLYLLALREDVLFAAGLDPPLHRRLDGSRGGIWQESTGTRHFGLGTALELDSLHTLFRYFMTSAIILTVLDNIVSFRISFDDADTFDAQTLILLTLAHRLLQSLRVIQAILFFYPFQPIIQLITLHNFYLDGKLQWGRGASSKELEEEEEREREARNAEALVLPQLPVEMDEHEYGVQSGRDKASEQPLPLSSADALSSDTPSSATCLRCFDFCFFVPLYMRTTFRPLPSTAELAARAVDPTGVGMLSDAFGLEAMAKAAEEVEAMQKEEELRQVMGQDGDESMHASHGTTSDSTGLPIHRRHTSSNMHLLLRRVLRAGRRFKQSFHEHIDWAAFRKRQEDQALDRAIARTQVAIWKRQMMGMKASQKYETQQSSDEKSDAQPSSTEMTASASSSSSSSSSSAAAPSPQRPPSNDEFSAIPADDSSSPTIVASRSQAHLDRLHAAATRQQRLRDELLQARIKAATGPHPHPHPSHPARLPPLNANAAASASASTAKATGKRKVVRKDPLATSSAASSSSVPAAPPAPLAIPPGLPIHSAEEAAVLQDPDDFCSVSRSSSSLPSSASSSSSSSHAESNAQTPR